MQRHPVWVVAGALLIVIAIAVLLPFPGQTQGYNAYHQLIASVSGADISLQENSVIQYHKLAWTVTGAPAGCTVKLEQSADNSVWSDLIANQTCTSNNSSTVVNASNVWVRINVTALSGGSSPVLTVTYTGYVQNPSGGGGSGIVNPNNGTANAIALYPAAGGSTTVGPDTLLTDNGTTLTYTGTGGVVGLVSANIPNNGANTTGTSAGLTGSPAIQVSTLTASTNVDVRIDLSIGSAAGHRLISASAPTISSGFGTSPSIAASNGTAAFTINVGTGGAASTGVIGLPAATAGWVCSCTDITTNSANVFSCKQTATTTNTATIGNFSDVAVATAWVASDIVQLSCFGF